MSQPEIWVSISIRGGQDDADQLHEKVLDLRITGAAPDDTQVMPAVQPVTVAAPARGQLPVVNIVIGNDADNTPARPDGVNGEVLAGNRGNGGCAGSFGGGRAAQSMGSARARGATIGGSTSHVPSLFGGRDGNRTVFGGGSGEDDDRTASIGVAQVGDAAGIGAGGAGGAEGDENNGYGGVPGKGWIGTGGRGGQSGAVSPVGYQSIAFAGFVGTNQGTTGAAGADDAPNGPADEVDAGAGVTGRTGQADDISNDDTGTVPFGDDRPRNGDTGEPTPGLGDHWGNGLTGVGGRGANGGSYGPVRPSTNGHSGSEG